MKKILLSSLLLVLSMSLFISCSDDDDDDIIIQSSELPQAAQNFVTTHFNGATYLRIEKDKKPDADGSLYEVYLSKGTTFNSADGLAIIPSYGLEFNLKDNLLQFESTEHQGNTRDLSLSFRTSQGGESQ